MGTAPRPIAVATVRTSRMRRPRSTRKPAIASTNATFPNSDGWNWNGPSSIQRFEPRIASANRKTKSIKPIVVPYTTRQ